MQNQFKLQSPLSRLSLVCTVLLLLAACALPAMPVQPTTSEGEHTEHGSELPELSPAVLDEGEKLRVVASTNILGDVVQNVGGEAIELTVLLPVGADPHGYTATPEDLRTLSDAHVIFVVGEGIEESLEDVLENREGTSALVAVNTGIDLIDMAEAEHAAEGEHEEAGEHAAEYEHTEGEAHAKDKEGEDHHHGVDPHTWTAVPNVIHWVETIEHTLSALDPANAATYVANAAAYTTELKNLDAEIASALAALPAASRKLVTDHETFGYFAARYDFELIGSVIPSFSTLAAPSAQELAALQEQITNEGVKAIFVGSTVNPDLAEQIAADVGVQVIPLYADSLSAPEGPAATYLELMRYNVNAISEALK